MVHASDVFISLENVSFIKQGWINRNKVILNGSPTLFTVPLLKASSNREICQTRIHPDLYSKWQKGFIKSVHQSYSKSINFNSFFFQLKDLLEREYEFINDLALDSIKICMEYLGISSKIYQSSSIEVAAELKGSQRILKFCEKLRASDYINHPGGKDLYSKESFKTNGIDLHFIKSANTPYTQMSQTFHSNLSILDAIFNCSKNELEVLLRNYELV